MRPHIQGSSILITGGAGFIGSHLADRLLKEGAKQVVVVDNLFLGKRENLSDALKMGAKLYVDDGEFFDSLSYIMEAHNTDIVFNLATKALNYSFVNPRNAFMTNVNVMANLLELQRAGRFSTLCHFSSSEVYGTAVYEPMDEKHPKNPTTTYAGGKAAADLMLETYVRMFQLDAFILRPFNNYGPRQNWEGPLAGIIPVTAKRILEGGKPEIHGTGKQSRDFILVTDTVEATVGLYGVMKAGESCNIATNGQIQMGELIEKICGMMGYQGEILSMPARGSDVLCHHASNEKLKSLIPFSPTPFDQGLRDTLAWYQKRLAGGTKA
jgi:UDP-glucose 4-epimerase